MALIAAEAFNNETVRTVASTRSYTLPATKNNPSGLTVTMGHKMLNPSDSRYYEGIIGGKTGYTSKAGNTLVTAVERNGVRLIAVIMKSKATHYTDTKALFDYGFALEAAGGTGSAAAAGSVSSETGNAQAGPGESGKSGWVKDGDQWYYVKENGTKAAGQWLEIEGESYWFDDNGSMAKGWRQIDGNWYYLRSNGAMAKNYWSQVKETGKWFYLGSDGALLVNTTTPDGYQVGLDGAWIS
jgi:D-alanyl-D-alanine carboxypeptidase